MRWVRGALLALAALASLVTEGQGRAHAGRVRGGYNRLPPRGGYKSNVAKVHAKVATDGGGGGRGRIGAAGRRGRGGRDPTREKEKACTGKVMMVRKPAGRRVKKCLCAATDVCAGSTCTAATHASKGRKFVSSGFDVAKCLDCKCVSPAPAQGTNASASSSPESSPPQTPEPP